MVLVGVLLAAAVATSTAHAPVSSDVAALFRDYGLFGAWAVDCKTQASPQNPHVSVSESEPGRVIERHDLGSRYGANTYWMLDARRVSATRLAVEALFQPNSEAEQTQQLVLAVEDRTRRTVFTQVEGGAVRVRDGVVVGHRAQTPKLKKCE